MRAADRYLAIGEVNLPSEYEQDAFEIATNHRGLSMGVGSCHSFGGAEGLHGYGRCQTRGTLIGVGMH